MGNSDSVHRNAKHRNRILNSTEKISVVRKGSSPGTDSLAHLTLIFFLFLIGVIALIILNIKGLDYYLTPLSARPFRADYESMRPSGPYSHGLGIIGALMIIIGVAMYSTRKRIRTFWTLGRLSRWLEIHIFLCLLGPILVIYHTTFKVGGIAAISLWTMVSVAASGIVGRFLYILIPRNLNGTELTLEEIGAELKLLSGSMQADEKGNALVNAIDAAFAPVSRPKSFAETVSTYLHLQKIKNKVKEDVRHQLRGSAVPPDKARELEHSANARVSLLQKTIVLSRVERLFFYWHAIHLPFSIIMFITLALHVVVAILLGYRWIL